MRFDGKRILVTGGTRGIGAATVRALLDAGAHVAIAGRGDASFDLWREVLAGENAIAVSGDVAGSESCKALVAAAIEGLGGLDSLINSAGVYEEAPVDEIDQGHWTRAISINLGGTFFCSQAALPALRASGGNIVNVASESGLVGYMHAAAYCAAKGGVVNLTKAMAWELAPAVRVNCVCPGNVDTDMMRRAGALSDDEAAFMAAAHAHAPMKRMAKPEEIAAAILYLASDAASFTTGVALPVDGGILAGV
jgi:meso-butanediol dehydrogenase / (S,S)-butanediol dehydrogenase / diacetyl reductase